MKEDQVVYTSTENKEYWSEEGCHILEIINNDKTKLLSIARARVGPGMRTRLHALEGTTEVYYILSGQGEANIDGLRYQVETGDCVYIQPSQDQSITNTGDEELTFLCVCHPRFEQRNYQDTEG